MKKIVYNIKEFWQNLCRWLAYFKVIRRTSDWDFMSLLEVELHQLTKLRDSIAKYQSHLNSWRDIRNMNWAISCLTKYMNHDIAIVKGTGEDSKYILNVYVNDKNATRFLPQYNNVPSHHENLLNIKKEALYMEKAWCLYNKIKKEHLREWWD